MIIPNIIFLILTLAFSMGVPSAHALAHTCSWDDTCVGYKYTLNKTCLPGDGCCFVHCDRDNPLDLALSAATAGAFKLENRNKISIASGLTDDNALAHTFIKFGRSVHTKNQAKSPPLFLSNCSFLC